MTIYNHLVETLATRSVYQPSGCREWMGARTRAGYGQLRVDGKTIYTHRIAWILEHGPIPVGMDICHRCDNPPCINVGHLFLGTRADNVRGMSSRSCSGNNNRRV